ncbi:hypothetical protein GCM10010219_65100 [Streptomyces netropsis]|nr:hypothetical protein GCM10010219_65100 [Streptomyces netropsis]
MELANLLPQLADVVVVPADVSDEVVAVRARTKSGVPTGCTGCGRSSAWCHSRYVRRLADVALGGRPLRIDLSVGRLYCENPSCPKVTFAEQVPGLTVRYQRRTPFLQGLVESVGVLLAGRGGARMPRILNTTLSRCTVLSQLMRMPLPPRVTPRVLGWTTSRSTATPLALNVDRGGTRVPIASVLPHLEGAFKRAEMAAPVLPVARSRTLSRSA